MNKERRKRLGEASDLLNQAKDLIETCKDEEQEYIDNMPDSFRNGDKGSMAETNAACLDEAQCAIEDSVETLEDICDKIDAAISDVESGQE